jgi:amino acid adenylation domain-containing protein
MMHNWDLLGDRSYSPDRPLRRETSRVEVLVQSGLPTEDAELLALLAAVLARYTGRDQLVLGWSDGGPWRPVDIAVDPGQPFAALVATAAVALAREPAVGQEVPAVGVGRAGAPQDGCPELLWVGADGSVTYATPPYSEADALRFAGHVATLTAARGRPDAIARLPLLRPVELAALHAGNAAGPLPDDTTTVADLIAAQVLERPDAVAVRAGGNEISYRQLWARSGAEAAHLRPGSLVGVWADRSVEMMIAFVAVLRAGAAYVALEPSYPAARLRALADAARFDTVLGNGDIDDLRLGEVAVRRIARVTGAAGAADAVPAAGIAEPASVAAASDLAYVMFTSGSTGRPKGVMVEHRGVVNLLRHMAREPGLAPGELMLGVTTPAFDLSVPDLFLPLVTGATLELVGADDARDGKRLAALIAHRRPSLMQATPSTWRMLIDAGWSGASQLRVVCGGEGYDAALTQAIHRRVAGIWNFYGPTETTVWSVSTALEAAVTDPIPIGVPMRGTACYVLDERGELVPPGVRGELHIAGAGVARGYLGQPELTAAAFVPCAFPGAPSTRMYRTGDLARSSPSGHLTFAGRRDFQVKLNGFRIELGEIETVVGSLPGVAQAVAVVRPTERGARLVCYVTGTVLDPHGLRAAVAAVLPQQSVPSAIVVLEALPLNSNGKVDRNALPAPLERTGEPLEGPFEQLVAGVWSDVLALPEVFAGDDIFEVGADSLDVGRIAIRLTARLATDVTPGDIFRHPTVRELARALLELVVSVEADLLVEAEAR